MNCYGKRSFETEHAARVELVGAIMARNKGNHKRKECRVYFCQIHQAWHLTSLPKWEDREGQEAV